MTKPSKKPPKHSGPQVGDLWFVQRTKGQALLTAHIDEVTKHTVVIRWVHDGSVRPREDAQTLRWLRTDIRWIERVAE